MDILQIALVFLILLLSIFLAIIGIQVFFILRDLKIALDKFDLMVSAASEEVSEVAQTVKEVVESPITQAVANVVKKGIAGPLESKSAAIKSSKRLFKIRK